MSGARACRLGQALNLVNGPTIADAIRAPEGTLAELIAVDDEPKSVVEELYLSFLCRFPTDKELEQLLPTLDVKDPENRFALEPEDAAELERRFEEWESKTRDVADWRVLAPVSATSAVPSAAIVQDDGSVRFAGDAPERDTYTLVFATDATGITGIRLEVLADSTLPAGGPGRAENGNFVLNEFKVTAIPAGDVTAAGPVELQNATADYSQGGYTVDRAIDGNDGTGWAVSPRFGQRHVAVFETKKDIGTSAGTVLVVTMDQRYGSKHNIGRPRISVTTSARPVRQHDLPEAVERALATPREERSEEQRSVVFAHFIESEPELAERILLGASQDLAWALANSPAFLFNR